MSMQMHLPWMLPKARTAYGKALQEVNGALKDKELVQDDGTLVAIILLCMFGAAAKLRASMDGRSFDKHIIIPIKLAAAASDSPATSSSSDDLDEPFSSSQEQPARTASYYTDIFIAGSWNTYRAYRILLRGTMKLCHDRIAALENLVSAAAPPPATVFNKLKASTPPPDVLSSYSIESPAAMAALPNVTVTSPEDVTESTSFCKDMIDDILASVPFCLGDIDSSGRIATRARPRAAGGYGLLFPLGIVSRSPFASKAQKSGVKAALERIGGQMSIRRARMQAEGVFGG
ncbi:MAG: hypothetical protein OHK93_001676 [Ramalina farinacea]|uniref:Uncharacterized protein n=1 Tax=Ramalina farinacea TaxID=258253 RepID=A0AA43TWH5_9LECA|nr:hypothetical protein [Ramalina farinacea]